MELRKGWPPFCSRYLVLVLMLISFQIRVFNQESFNWETPFKKCWELAVGFGAIGGVASDNNSLIFNTDRNTLYSINVESGKENWKTTLGGNIRLELISDKKSIIFFSSIETIDNNNNNNLIVYSIDNRTGITNWRFETQINGKLTILQNENQFFLVENNGLINCFDKIEGKRIWKKNLSTEIESAIILDSNQLLVLTSKEFTILSTKIGDILKVISIKQKLSNILFFNNSKKEFIAGNSTGNLFSYSLIGNKTLWSVKLGGGITSLLITDFGLLVSSLDNFIYLFDIKNGRLKWRKRISGRINITPTIIDKYLIVLNSSTNIALIIDIKSGKSINQISINEDDVFLGSPIIFNDFIVFRSYRGIYAFSNLSCQK